VNLQRLERCLLVSSRCHFAAFAGARVGEPHRRPTQAIPETEIHIFMIRRKNIIENIGKLFLI
jgi:hypothetical protein